MRYKIAIIAGLGAVIAGAFGYFFSVFSLTNSVSAFGAAFVALVLYLSLFTVRMLVVRRGREAVLYIVLDGAVFGASFAYHFSVWFFAGLTIAGIWLWYAWREGRRATQNMIRLRVRDLGPGFLKSSFRAMIFLAIATYLSFVNPTGLSVSRAAIDSAVRAAGSGAGFETVQKIFGQGISNETQEAATERVVVGIHAAANRFISFIPPQFKTGFLVGLGIIMFVLATSVIGFFVPIINLCVWGVLQLLLRMRFISMEIEKVEREYISI